MTILTRQFLSNISMYAAIGAIVFIGCWWYTYLRKTTPVQRLAALEKEVKPKGGEVFKTVLAGKPVVFLLVDCALYILDTSGEEIERTKVLRTGFYLGLDVCTRQSIEMEGEYVKVYLANRAIGAGGGNTSGGHYRSKDGRNWERLTGQDWQPLKETQI